ncbi:MAG: transposase [Bacteroidia bacterium]
MTTRTAQTEKEIIFYITITCHKWIRLFEITDFYDAVYKWFDVLKELNNQVNGYVIMPNHLHALIRVDKDSAEINKLVANGKRFMAYEIVKRLEQLNKNELLRQLEKAVSFDEQRKGKLHEIFEPSFDCKPCYTNFFLEQKLDYIHHNPCSGKWNLADEFTNYKHSSAVFYELDEACEYKIDDYRLLEW